MPRNRQLNTGIGCKLHMVSSPGDVDELWKDREALCVGPHLHLGKQFLLLIEAFVLQRTCNPSFLNLSKLFPAKDSERKDGVQTALGFCPSVYFSLP